MSLPKVLVLVEPRLTTRASATHFTLFDYLMTFLIITHLTVQQISTDLTIRPIERH